MAQFACALRLVAVAQDQGMLPLGVPSWQETSGLPVPLPRLAPQPGRAGPSTCASRMQHCCQRLPRVCLVSSVRHPHQTAWHCPSTCCVGMRAPWRGLLLSACFQSVDPAAAHGRLGLQAQAPPVLPLPVQQRSLGRLDAAGSQCMGEGPAGLQGSQETAELAGPNPSGPLVDWGVSSFGIGAGHSVGSLDDLSLRGARLRSNSIAQQGPASPGLVSSAAPGMDALRRLRRSSSAQSARTSSPPPALCASAMEHVGADLELSGRALQQEGLGRMSSDGAQPGQLPLVRTGSAWSGQPEGVPAGRGAGRPIALELRLPPLHPKLSARLALLAAGGGLLFAGEPGGCMVSV